MNRIGTLVAGVAGLLAFATAVQAADPPRTWRRPAPAEAERESPRYTELMSGWYLRGDLSYRLNSIESLTAPRTVTGVNYPNSLGGTFGVGYKYQWMRADLTFDYGSRVKAAATTSFAATQPQYTAHIESMAIMANFYADLGTWWGLTPYIGAGVGGSYLRARNYLDTSLPMNFFPGNSKTNLAWAGMVGVAWQFTPTWALDIGYRYMALGDLATDTGSGTNQDGVTWKNLRTQEIRVGLRWLFD